MRLTLSLCAFFALCASLLCLLTLPASSIAAQEAEIIPITYDVTIAGRIGNRAPRQTYAFEGLRGERIAITVRVTGGDLDPVLVILDPNNALIEARDDAAGGRGVTLELSIPQSGFYTIVVGRFGYTQGSTSGDYELRVERIGVSSASGSMLRYGDSVLNSIDTLTPQVYYSFRADQGDIINIRMRRTSGNLDPYLLVVDSRSFIVAENDDIPGSGTLDAEVQALVIQETGTFVIVATRFGQTAGDSVGTFVLTIDEAANSGLGNSARAALPILPNTTVEGVLSAERYEQFYRFEAQTGDIISVRMERPTGSLDSLLVLTDASLQVLAENDDFEGSQNARINEYLIPAPGTYYIIATRYQRANGTTTGAYRLTFEVRANPLDEVPAEVQRIAFGSTVTGRVDDDGPQVVYAFYAQQGESFIVTMTRGDGDLAPVVAILDETRRLIVASEAGDGRVATIDRFVAPRSAVYFLLATRVSAPEGGGTTSGSYLLVISRRFD